MDKLPSIDDAQIFLGVRLTGILLEAQSVHNFQHVLIFVIKKEESDIALLQIFLEEPDAVHASNRWIYIPGSRCGSDLRFASNNELYRNISDKPDNPLILFKEPSPGETGSESRIQCPPVLEPLQPCISGCVMKSPGQRLCQRNKIFQFNRSECYHECRDESGYVRSFHINTGGGSWIMRAAFFRLRICFSAHSRCVLSIFRLSWTISGERWFSSAKSS